MTEHPQNLFEQEHQLLLLCARTQMDPQHVQQVNRLTQKNLNWTYLLATANQHGILPLLFHNLSSWDNAIPPHVSGQLRMLYGTNSLRNEMLAKELITLIKGFHSENIAALPFKGPALAGIAYGNLSLREFVDLDILVTQDQLVQAFGLMQKNGYYLKWHEGGDHHQAPSPHKKTYTFTRGKGLTEIRVDLQSLIIGDNFSTSIGDRTVWNRVTELPLLGVPIPGLALEDLLVTLCIHGSKHLWEKTKWICDVAELLQRYHHTLNWELVFRQADRLECRNMLELGLHMAENLKNFGLTNRGTTPPLCQKVTISNRLTPVVARWLWDQLLLHSNTDQKDLKVKAFYLFIRENGPHHIRKYLYLCLIPLPKVYWPMLPHPRLYALFQSSVSLLHAIGKYGLRSQSLKKSIGRWVKLVGQ